MGRHGPNKSASCRYWAEASACVPARPDPHFYPGHIWHCSHTSTTVMSHGLVQQDQIYRTRCDGNEWSDSHRGFGCGNPRQLWAWHVWTGAGNEDSVGNPGDWRFLLLYHYQHAPFPNCQAEHRNWQTTTVTRLFTLVWRRSRLTHTLHLNRT
jgi:hypothetical protein